MSTKVGKRNRRSRKNGPKFTRSLKDLLVSLDIYGSTDWLEYVNKITEMKAAALKSEQQGTKELEVRKDREKANLASQ
ncbi:uncharacterized protein LOC108105765 [Drosophila eugracilis]|uniref:uncharacterized protein LOC108105765 n=1 Tax=Drosophila eugracilis TaxID=29029 RepID=UPI001BDB0428|nr:uncharacterized protein LOC108105765 [Drosophila eugracilis]